MTYMHKILLLLTGIERKGITLILINESNISRTKLLLSVSMDILITNNEKYIVE
jgi:hypothetical protein